MKQTKRQKEWVKANREKVRGYWRDFYRRNADRLKATKVRTPLSVRRAQCRAWKKANPEKVAASLRKLRYGVSPAEHTRMFTKQRGLCAICRKGPAECVDHCHVSKKVRGLLCRRCNLGVGIFADSPKRLRQAAVYLEGSHV